MNKWDGKHPGKLLGESCACREEVAEAGTATDVARARVDETPRNNGAARAIPLQIPAWTWRKGKLSFLGFTEFSAWVVQSTTRPHAACSDQQVHEIQVYNEGDELTKNLN